MSIALATIGIALAWRWIRAHPRYAPRHLTGLVVVMMLAGATAVLSPLSLLLASLATLTHWWWRRRGEDRDYAGWEADLRRREAELSNARDLSAHDRRLLVDRERHQRDSW